MSVDVEEDLEERRQRLVQLVAGRSEEQVQGQAVETTGVETCEAAVDEEEATRPDETSVASRGPITQGPADAPEHGFAEIGHHGSRKSRPCGI